MARWYVNKIGPLQKTRLHKFRELENRTKRWGRLKSSSEKEMQLC
ncbi:hypothetical protein COLO4_03036 [Corchorus olitorius]|uniref:Uncharacterized protein n=1 Tax=Corchorus olitorius TaxID=93759 RepID=A0A1R3KZM7_9ROSI|nr:hypothetical protein COLO4_03036 [Corchorus olitorius]